MVSNLVGDGIIDQETADKISAYQELLAAESEVKEDGEYNQGERHDPFSDMISAGVITQEQADAIKAAMPAPLSEDLGKGGF